MNNNDLDIYKLIQPDKSLTEIYLGHIQYPWKYSIVDYSADRTEGIPFNVFDKVLCGLLNIDGTLSITQMGKILGMNIEDDVPNGKYRDFAEYEILSEQLQALVKYGLISVVGGVYKLTNIGFESIKVGRKFRKTKGYNFSLYYDITGGQNALAKQAFEDAEKKPCTSDVVMDYTDTENVKSFINSQISNIYSPEDGNSLSNLRVENLKEYEKMVDIGIVYDFLKKEYKLFFHTPMVDCNLYDKAIEEHPDLKSDIISSFFASRQHSSTLVSDIQKQFEENAIEAQRNIEYKKYLEQDITQDLKTYHDAEELIIPEEFWNNLTNYILPYQPNRVCFNIKQLTIGVMKSIRNFATQTPGTKFYLSFQEKEDGTYLTESANLYIRMVNNESSVLCSINNKAIYETSSYVYSYRDKKYDRDVICRMDSDQDATILFDMFAKSWVPGFLSSFRSSIENRLIEDASGINYLMSLENKIGDFMPYISQLGLLADYNDTVAKRNKILATIKHAHAEKLKDEVTEKVGQINMEGLNQLKDINDIKKILENIEEQCYEDYTEVKELIGSYKSKLKERESFVKDILMAKTYIIDTNIFLECPEIISKIKMPNKVAICAKVTDELDKFKIRTKDGNELHENATKALRNINQALKKERSKVVVARADTKLLPVDFTDKSADNLILSVALMYKDKNPCLLTSDNGLQIKAQTCDIPTKDLDEFFEMIEAKKAEKEKGSKVESINVTKTKPYRKNKRK